MNAVIISYSLTGRNDTLAQMVSKELGLENIKITEKRQRKTMTVTWDLVFGRVPKVQPEPSVMDKYDLVIFFSPVWMGMPATPLNAYFRHIKKTGKRYAFMTLCGGAGEKNPMLKDSIIKRTCSEPVLLMEQHVSDLMKDKEPTLEMAKVYNVSQEEFEMLSKKYINAVKDMLE